MLFYNAFYLFELKALSKLQDVNLLKNDLDTAYQPQLLHYCYYDTRHSTLAAADAVLPDGGHGVHGDVRCDAASGCEPARGAPAP